MKRDDLDTSMSDYLVDQLQRRIFNGEIPVGSWLRHAALAEEFDVSRTPVREALHVLNARGIVTIVPNRGARVNGLSGQDMRELGAVRAELEGFAAELAATRITDRQLERLREGWQRYERKAGTGTGSAASGDRAHRLWADANQAFHGLVLEASGNHFLGGSIADISRRLPRNSAFAAYAGSTRLLKQNSEEHYAIVEALASGDASAARAAMTRHLRSATETMARWTEARQREHLSQGPRE